MVSSKFDELHNRFFSILNSKNGTRYERLAAIVFKALDERNTVIHDFKLRGASSIKHQIDVLIEINGEKKRVLIECKDFDRSQQLVGLSIIRDFRSVVEDAGVDEAFVVTCTGYTRPARKYAKAKGIKLAVLRVFEEADWEGRIRTVIVNFIVQAPPRLERAEIRVASVEQQAAIHADAGAEGVSFPNLRRGAPVYLVSGFEQVGLFDYLEIEANKLSGAPTGLYTIDVDPSIWQLRFGERSLHSFDTMRFTFRTSPSVTETIEVGSQRIAELILQGFGNDDIVIFADQLERAKIDSEGRVLSNPAPNAPNIGFLKRS